MKRKPFKFVVGTVAAMILAGVIAPSAGAATTRAFSDTTVFPRRWAPVFMSPKAATQSEAINVAKTFDVVAANTNSFKSWVSVMHTTNPNLKLLAYVNGTFSMNDNGARYPSSWYAHDAAGNLIRSVYNNLLMTPSNPSWSSDVASRCNSAITGTHYDGCLIDTLGVAIFSPGYVTSLPINPATGSAWTVTDWIAATVGIAGAVKSKVGAHPVVANGIAWGKKYFDATAPTKQLLGATDGGMVELFMRAPFVGPTFYRNETDWKTDVDMLVDAGASGSSLFTTTKVWNSTATDEQKRQWHKFALASFLLGTDGRSYFSFLGSQTWASVTANDPWDTVAVGTPTSAYAKVGGLYQRTFTNGLALVNPTKSPVTLTLDRAYTTLDGVSLSTITLAAETGEVLLPQSSTSYAGSSGSSGNHGFGSRS